MTPRKGGSLSLGQGHCQSPAKCGFCAGPHETRDCSRKPDEQRCPNCQKAGHSAWEKAKCGAYSHQEQYRLVLRATLDQKTAQWDSEKRARESQSFPSLSQFSFIPNKCQIPPGGTAAPRKRGAPTAAERLQQQQRGQISLFGGPALNVSAVSTQTPPATLIPSSQISIEEDTTMNNPWN